MENKIKWERNWQQIEYTVFNSDSSEYYWKGTQRSGLRILQD